MNILCVSRGVAYSPNLVSNDATIFTAVVDELKALGHETTTISEDRMGDLDLGNFDRVMTMARNISSLTKLMQETNGKTRRKFINSIDGILTCANKAKVATLMLETGIPQPEFMIGEKRNLLYCSAGHKEDITAPIWLKNSDGSATVAKDTVYCPTKDAFDAAFRQMEARKVNCWMVQEHKPGDLIKFYGVEGTDFFRWNYASQGHSKFGWEAINGKEKGYPFDAERIKRYADMTAKQLNVPVYGGDVIIDEQGQFWFIDFNDFPSFSSCRDEAAKAIARRVESLEFRV